MASKLKTKRKIISRANAILKPVGPRYYFAYGSNLSVAGMTKRCPDAKKIKALQLRGCKLVFRGVADVEITNNENDWVEGGLWRISTYDEGRLDSYEGVSLRDPKDGLYRKLTFPIGNTRDDTVWDCLIYKMNRTGIMPPSEHYFNIIKQGYEDFGLDLSKLNEALMASWDDKQPTPQLQARRDRNGRPPLASRPGKEEVVVETVGAGKLPSWIENDVPPPEKEKETVQHFVPPDQWVDGRSSPLVAPEKKTKGTSPSAEPSCASEVIGDLPTRDDYPR